MCLCFGGNQGCDLFLKDRQYHLKMMNSRDCSPSSFFLGERADDVRNMDHMMCYSGLKSDGISRTKGVASSPIGNRILLDPQAAKDFSLPEYYLSRGRNSNLPLDIVGEERIASHSLPNAIHHDLGAKTNLNVEPTSYFIDGDKINLMGAQYENGLFSSSLSDLFIRDLKLSSSYALYGHSVSVVAPVSNYDEEEAFESLEELEAQTIGNLLPDDDDLLSGVTDGFGSIVRPNNGEDMEDLDLFSSVGGLELGEENSNNQLGVSRDSNPCQHPFGEHPSRTLFVRNIISNVEDSELQTLFEQYGEIRTLYTACKHRGFVMISYYDIRASQNAMKALQNKPLRHRKLDIHYSIPKEIPSEKDINQGTLVVCDLDYSVSKDKLREIFGVYGDMKEIRDTPHGKSIEFYDVRAAESALRALNRSDIAGKQIKLESGQPGGSSRLTQHFPSELELEESSFQLPQHSPHSNLPAGYSAFGSSGTGSCPSPGHHYMWSNSHHSQPQAILWPSSPQFVNGMGAPHPQQLHVVPRAPSHMLNTLLPSNNHHVGSAPSVNPSLWDRRHAYAGESPDATVFHPGSLGNMRISGNSPHPLELVPYNILPRNGGNGMDVPIPSKDGRLHSQQQRCMIFPARGQMLPMMGSFDSLNERTRNRRNESGASQGDSKKQFELDIERIVRGEDKRTTLMIKNIPNKYTSKMLLAAIDERHKGTYDFIYLPIDFKNKCNVGYAFINMTDPSLIVPFYRTFNGKKWEKFNSEKVASLAYARIQGKAALIAHFQNSSLMNEDKRCRPILFHTDGPNAGDQVPFPMGTNIRPRPGKTRAATSEENNQEVPPNSLTGEDYCNGDSSSGSCKDSD